ncbi:hypothetical protein JKY79_00940 [Candidatus Babeliales bacterium]|nr:hypothetical protein [Candidatus Babeliales bacterium]
MDNRFLYLSVGRLLFLSFFFLILSGFLLLSLPMAQLVPMSNLDVLFTATSVTCVTGLRVIPIESFSLFGHQVIFILMQIGGLGLMTFSLFLFSLFSQFGLATTVMAGKLLDFEVMNRVKFFLGMVVVITLVIEGIGTILLYPFFSSMFPWHKALFYAAFHSVSAYCNAGICLFDTSLQAYQQNIWMLSVLGALALFGGIGFIVWYEIGNRFRHLFLRFIGKEKRLHAFSLHTKLVLWTSFFLLLIGTVVFAANEWSHAWGHLIWYEKIANAFFLSIVSRSAGFMTTAVTEMRNSTILFLMGLMFIGASPSSTGGGIKTTTIALIFATMLSVIRGRAQVECFGREVLNDQIYKAITILILGFCWISMTAFLLLWLEKGHSFIDVFFEAVSAFSTVGFSRGITESLGSCGKIILIVSMLVGRIGSLTLVLAVRKVREKKLYTYPEERVLIG